MSYLDQINNIQSNLFQYQEQLQGQQDNLIAEAQNALAEKVQNVAEKLEFIGTAGMAGIETLGKVKDIVQKGVKIYQKGKQVVQQGQEAVEQLGERIQTGIQEARAGAQRIIAGAQQTAENLGIGDRTAGLTGSLSTAIEQGAEGAGRAVGGAVSGAQSAISGAVARADEAVGRVAGGAESAISGAQATARAGLEQAGQQMQSRLAELGAQGQERIASLGGEVVTRLEPVRATAEQVAGGIQEQLDPLRGSIEAYRNLPDLSAPRVPTMEDPADTLLNRLTEDIGTDIGPMRALGASLRPEVQAVLRGEAPGGLPGSSVRTGDAINEFLGRTQAPPRAVIADSRPSIPMTSSESPAVQVTNRGINPVNQQQRASLEQDPEAGIRFENPALDDIPAIGNLSAQTATRSLTGGATVANGSTVSGATGATTETTGTTGSAITTGTTTTTTGTTTTGTVTTGTTEGGAVVGGTTTGEAVGEGIGSLIGDSIPVVGELAMLGTALAGIFESIFKHPVETFTPQIVSAVGYDPSSLTNTFSGEGGTV